MNKHETLKHIYALYSEIYELSENLIEQEARKVMEKHDTCKEFIMGMGSACFYDKNGKPMFYNDYKYLNGFNAIVDELDDICKVSGSPMRFKRDEPKRTNW